MGLEDIEALQGADLRQLRVFLGDKDKGCAYGNLFKICTPEGHVKWVCIDHRNGNYHKAAMKWFEEVISANGGGWTGVDGPELNIQLRSKTIATQFYEAMVNAHGVHFLDITLQWNVSLGDLEELSSAVDRANITRLALHVTSNGPARDVINKRRRYNPILKLMCNNRIQEMKLREFSDFYKRIDVSVMKGPSRLQKLNLPLYTRPYKSILLKLLKRCSCLVELELQVSDFNEAFEDITTDLTILPSLQKLVLSQGLRCVIAAVSQGRIQSMSAPLWTGCIWGQSLPGLESLFRKGLFTELTAQISSSQHASRLANMIQWNPRLHNIRLSCHMEDAQTLMDAITSTRERMLLEQDYLEPIRVSLSTFAGDTGGINIQFEFRNETTTPTALSRDVGQPTLNNTWMLSRLFLEYGHCIDTLRTFGGFNDELAAMLDSVTEQRGSKITSLELNVAPLTNVGLESMVKVIERSQDLHRLEFIFTELETRHQQEKLNPLIRRCGQRLHGLKVEGDSADVWIPKVMALCPTRPDLPQLESFSLATNDGTQLSDNCIRWIVSMVSPPPQEQPTYSLEPSSQSATVSPEASMCEWNPLSYIKLKHISPHIAVWESVIRAIDYSVLRTLDVEGGFSFDDMDLLRACAPVGSNPVVVLNFSIISTSFIGVDFESLAAMVKGQVEKRVT
ncbi:MAG: hypothetical protein J3Q66DRAFT_399605 [Benniella sp.]|nr:MAG: hypothetical protein J3Q66DRAFT_399605 [Benniella sp.]